MLTTALKASLEAAIDKWIEDNADEIDIWWCDVPAEKLAEICSQAIGMMSGAVNNAKNS